MPASHRVCRCSAANLSHPPTITGRCTYKLTGVLEVHLIEWLVYITRALSSNAYPSDLLYDWGSTEGEVLLVAAAHPRATQQGTSITGTGGNLQ